MDVQLSQLIKGQKAVVIKISESDTAQRLLELGLVPGTEVIVKAVAPFQSTFALQLEYFSLGIRKEDAEHILVKIK